MAFNRNEKVELTRQDICKDLGNKKKPVVEEVCVQKASKNGLSKIQEFDSVKLNPSKFLNTRNKKMPATMQEMLLT